jgi:hypothetical protein
MFFPTRTAQLPHNNRTITALFVSDTEPREKKERGETPPTNHMTSKGG